MMRYIVIAVISGMLAIFMTLLSGVETLLTAGMVDAYLIAKNDDNYKAHTITVENIESGAISSKMAHRGQYLTYYKKTGVTFDDSFESEVKPGDIITVTVLEKYWQHDMMQIIVSVEKDDKQYIDSVAQRKGIENWAKSVTTEILLIWLAFWGITFVFYGIMVTCIIKGSKKKRKIKAAKA